MDREAEITQRIELLKKKNEQLMQRHKEIEEDRKNAEKSGSSIHVKSSTVHTSKRKGDHGTSKHSNAHMDHMESVSHQKHQPTHHPRGRGAAPHRRPGRGRGRGGRGTYDEKRMENFRRMEEEMANLPVTDRSHDIDSGVTRFLDDPRRRGELEPEDRWKTTRHKGSYGGLEFDNVKQGMRKQQRRGNYRGGQGRGNSKLQLSAEWTGRERQDHERWMEMREAADKEIMSRSKNTQGKWRREWDSAKLDHDDNGFDRDERQRRQGSSGRGKHWPRGGRGSGRRGSRSSRDGENDRKESTETEDAALVENKTEESYKTDQPDEPEDTSSLSQKPQTQRQNMQRKDRKKMSPRHLKQQRAQTPSSKDGTELWAQNSHNSDEAGAEWKNGSSRSAEQWLPSDEGNRNPAIDERMLEQQEGGATIYSRQLGRGWGDEKNIKATKAWVIDTEKAGATKTTPEFADEGDKPMERGRIEGRTFDKMHTGRKGDGIRTEASRLKDDATDKTRFRSASPRLKRDNPGLTVEINKNGGRRVKRYSEGDSRQIPSDEQVEPQVPTESAVSPQSPNNPQTPFSAGILKTPEGVEYVPDWAAEMDMQSPTYVKRQLEITAPDSSANKQEVDIPGPGDAACTPEKDLALNSESKLPLEIEESNKQTSTPESNIASNVDEAPTSISVPDPNDEPEDKAMLLCNATCTPEKDLALNSESKLPLEISNKQTQTPESNIASNVDEASTSISVPDPSVEPEDKEFEESESGEHSSQTEQSKSVEDAKEGFADAKDVEEDEFYECDDDSKQVLDGGNEEPDVASAEKADAVLPAPYTTLETIQSAVTEDVIPNSQTLTISSDGVDAEEKNEVAEPVETVSSGDNDQ